MKKLMTMIAAVATAFGLYAATDLPSSTSFESAAEFDENGVLITGGDTKWEAYTETDAKLSQTKYKTGEAYPYSGTARYTTFGADQNNYLTVKTAFDKPLNRTFTEAAATDNAPVFIDQLVKFTAADEDIEINDATAKIGVWARELYAQDGETVTGTNLFVTAGPVVDSKPTVYDLGTIDVEAWHRLTIKVIKAKTAELGYEIFVDGNALAADKKGYASNDGLSIEAQALNAAKKIFPAMVTGLGVASLGIAGQGAIDDMMATTDSPGDWADTKSITLDFEDSEVAKLVYVAFGEEGSVERTTATSVTLPYITGMTLSIDMAKTECTGAYKVESVSSTGGASFNKETGAINGLVENDTIYIKTKDYAQRIKIGDNFYANFADAIAAIPAGSAATLVLNQDVNVGKNGTQTEAKFEGKGDITIDLNGQTITGIATGFAGYVINCQGNLIITNSQTAGGIATAAGTTYSGVVGVYSPDVNARKLTIFGGQFDGKVYTDAGDGQDYGAVTSEVSGGKFKYATNKKSDADEFALTVKEGFVASKDAEQDPAYWVVSEIPGNTLKVTKNEKATFVLTVGDAEYTDETMPADGIEVKPGVAYELVASAAANYDYNGEATKTISGNMPDEALTLTVPAPTATVKTITYKNEDEVEIDKVTYSVENYPEALKEYKKPGYNAAAWLDEGGNVFTLDDLKKINPVDDIELMASFYDKAITYTIKYTTGNGAVVTNGVTEYTIESDTFNLPVAADIDMSKVEGVTFAGWTNATSEAVVTKVDKGTTGDLEFFAKWEAVAPAEKDPTEDDPTQIPDDETAATRYGDKVPTTLANVSAKSIAIWAQNKGKLEKGDDILENAFLLNCENAKTVVDDLEAAFKIPSITVAADGTVTVEEPEGDFNGEIEQWGKVELDQKEWVKDQEGAKFFMLKLVPKNLN